MTDHSTSATSLQCGHETTANSDPTDGRARAAEEAANLVAETLRSSQAPQNSR
ncbi:hypothetical protein ACFQJ7_13515 [Halovenus rubra]|uniref:Uncharacterized protein n=2 Tax=Halovenus rubra TaxID=869890 RepID=A0ABD5X715_9EURY|nr:hypothetical protein [Halovenus rubra]